MATMTYAGVSRTDITPNFPVDLQTARPEPTDQVAQPLHVRVVVLKQPSAGAGAGERDSFIVLVSADIIYFIDQRVASLRRKIFERWGIPADAVLLHGTHTHSAPRCGDRIDPGSDGPYERFIRLLEDGVMEGIERAMADLEPVVLERGAGHCDIGTHRRKRIDGHIVMAPDADGPTDPEVSVLRLKRENGSTKALLVHFTCHPTTTYDNMLSSEYPGVAMDDVERRLGGGAVSVFLQGCCGDIKIAVVRDGRYYSGSNEEVVRFGRRLADEVIRVAEQPMAPLPFAPFRTRLETVRLPYQYVPTRQELERYEQDDGLLGIRSRILLRHPELNRPAEPFELGLMQLAQGLSLLTMNAELVVEYGLFVKSRYAGEVLPLGYSNGHTTYVATAAQIADGGYEGYEAMMRHGKPSPFAPEAEAQLKQAMRRLVEHSTGSSAE